MGSVFLRNCNCLGVKAGGLFIWVVFFLLFLVAAKGRRPPFCLFDVLLLVPLHLFFLLRTMMSSCRLHEYTLV